MRFSKASFTVEGTPAGWDKIDGIRLSAWRPMGKDVGDTNVRFRRLAAVWHDVALVVPAPDAIPHRGRRGRRQGGFAQA